MDHKTALVLIDVYNDFLHPKGKATAALAESLADSSTIEHIQQLLKTARLAKVPVFYSLHQQYRDGKYTGFEHWNDMLTSVKNSHSFEEGSWGAEIFSGLEPDPKNGDVVISKHWNQRYFSLGKSLGGAISDLRPLALSRTQTWTGYYASEI
jgi:nicotinamidase-related amidase